MVIQSEAKDLCNWRQIAQLLRSLPRLDSDEREPLRPIEGMPPDLTAMPGGCAFHPRCPFAVDRCVRDVPELERFSSGQAAACWVTQAGKDLNDLEAANDA